MAGAKMKFSSDSGKIAGLYDLGETIGRGHFAVVKLARHVFTGEKVAVKVIDKTKLDETSKAHLFQEVRCMKLVQHPHVVRLYEVIDTHTKLYLILEWGDGGDMYDHIMKHDKGLSEDTARRYFKQIVQAISYCHQLHVVHRDLKPENVVFFEKQGIVKLTDFGFSNKFVPGKKLETSCGSLAYSAPEILLGDSYDAPAVDVWSLGVILYMLVCGTAPFQEANDSETLTMILDCKYNLPHHVSRECHSLISQLLRREPNDRADLSAILRHPWMCAGPSGAATSSPPTTTEASSADGATTVSAPPPPPPPIVSMPLVSEESISDDDHNKIVQRMTDGKIATKEEIMRALEQDEYSYITATYYLLAERLLRRHHQEQNHHQPSSGQLRKHSLSTTAKLKLEPLALSPRVSPRRFAPDGHGTMCDDRREYSDEDDDVNVELESEAQKSREAARSDLDRVLATNSPSPFSDKVFNSLVSPPSTKQMNNSIFSQSPEDDGDADDDDDLKIPGPSQGFMPRQCSLIQEEEEDDEHGAHSRGSLNSLHGSASEKSINTPSTNSGSGGNGNFRKPSPANRTLHTVRSSPLLLNQISEECEACSDDEDILAPIRTSLVRNKTVASPDMLRKFAGRRRLSQRGTSCSSSDASDTDESETRKRKEKLKDKFQRKDSSDYSESDGGGPPSGGGKANGGTGGPSADRTDDKHDEDDNNSDGGGGSGGSGGGGGGGNRRHGKQRCSDASHCRQQPVASSSAPVCSHTTPKGQDQQSDNCAERKPTPEPITKRQHSPDADSEDDQKRSIVPSDTDFRKEAIRKISNLSISSVLSTTSISSSSPSRSSRYIVESVSACSTPARYGQHRSDVYTLNELKKVRTRVMNLSARDFADFRDSALSRDNSFKTGGFESDRYSDRTSICSADCPQSSGAGAARPTRRRSRHKHQRIDINSNGLIVEEGSKDLTALDKTKSRCCCLI